MDPIILLTILFLAFLTVSFFVWYFVHKSKQNERLLLLEKGVDLSDLPERSMFEFPWLKVGCVLTSIAVGLIIGVSMQGIHDGTPLFGLLLFGGIGLIIAHYVDNPHKK